MTHRTRGSLAVFVCALSSLGCDGAWEDWFREPPPPADTPLTHEHRAALPQATSLEMPTPGISTGDARFPDILEEGAELNQLLEAQLALLELMADRAPSSQDPARKLTTWGPFVDETTPFLQDELLLRVRSGSPGDGSALDGGSADEEGPSPAADFAFLFTMSRRLEDDGGSEQIVLWGGTRTDENGKPEGVLVFDLEANRRFDAEHNPVVQRLEAGRLALAFADLQEPAQHLVAASFRDFVARDALDDVAPVDLDQRWGNAPDGARTIQFVTTAAPAQLDDESAGIELVTADCSFLEQGAGRADFIAVAGDIPPGFAVQGQECWSAAGAVQYAAATLVHTANAVPPSPAGETTGAPSDCSLTTGWPVPDVDALPPALVTWLTRGAAEGAEAISPLHTP